MKLFGTETIIGMMVSDKHEYGSISIITLIEFLRGVCDEKRNEVKRLLEESFEVVWFDNDIIPLYCKRNQKEGRARTRC